MGGLREEPDGGRGGRAADKGPIPWLNGSADGEPRVDRVDCGYGQGYRVAASPGGGEGGWLTGGAAPTPTPRIDPLPWATGMGTGTAPSAEQGEGPLLLEEHGEGGCQVERL